MLRLTMLTAFAAVLMATGSAEARKSHQPTAQAVITCNERGCSDWVRPSAKQAKVARTKTHRRARKAAAPVYAMAEPTVVPDVQPDTWPRTLHSTIQAGPLLVIDGCAGLRLKVASEHASKFQGFFCALKDAGHPVASIGTACQAYGHMRGSKHDWGGACDVMQRARSRTVKFMYHITAIAQRFGLKDGCVWRGRSGPDCGHVEVQGSNAGARSAHYARYGKSGRRVAQR